jgi:ribosomal protein S18 acetylase RimI-like enzyme
MSRISRLDAGCVDAVAPLWQELQAHHTRTATHLAAVRPFREPEESWQRRREQYLGHFAGDLPATLLLAESGYHTVGYAMVRGVPAGPTLRTGDVVGHLDSLVVAPEYRSTGVGGELLDAVQATLGRWGLREVSLNVMAGNTRAEQFYRRRGFVPFASSFIGAVR